MNNIYERSNSWGEIGKGLIKFHLSIHSVTSIHGTCLQQTQHTGETQTSKRRTRTHKD